jgi:DNA-binding MarR family transcriptional regulator
MIQIDDFLDLLLDNAKKLFYPEEWIQIDLSFSKTEIFCLLWIHRHQEVTMGQLADMLHIPMSTATGIVNRLVKHEYITRYRSEADRRIVLLSLHEKGDHLIQDMKKSASRYLHLFTEVLTEQEQLFLLQTVKKIFNHLQEQQEKEAVREDNSQSIKNIPIE